MLTTIIYLVGALSLHFTDMTSQSGFASLFLPMVNILFFIFLVWQLVFYFSLHSFSGNDDSLFIALLREFWNLNENMREYGVARTLLGFAAHLFNAACFLTAVYYYFSLFLDFV